MSGFIIGDTPRTGTFSKIKNQEHMPNSTDWMRDHRFYLKEFLDLSSEIDGILALKDVSLPDKEISKISVKTPGTTYKFASQASYSTLKMTLYGQIRFLEKLYRNMENVHSLSEGIGDYNKYKGVIKFDVYSLQKETGTVSLRYTYQNCWISSVKHGNLSFTSSEIKSIDVNIEFDFYEVSSVVRDQIVGQIIGNS